MCSSDLDLARPRQKGSRDKDARPQAAAPPHDGLGPRRQRAVHPVAWTAFLSPEEPDPLELKLAPDERFETDAAGDDIPPEDRWGPPGRGQSLGNIPVGLLLEEGDLALVILLVVEESVPFDAAPGDTPKFGNLDHGVVPRRLLMVADKIVARRQEKMGQFRRIRREGRVRHLCRIGGDAAHSLRDIPFPPTGLLIKRRPSVCLIQVKAFRLDSFKMWPMKAASHEDGSEVPAGRSHPGAGTVTTAVQSIWRHLFQPTPPTMTIPATLPSRPGSTTMQASAQAAPPPTDVVHDRHTAWGPVWLLALWILGVPACPGVAAQSGRTVYEQHCAACHGASGDGNGPASVWLFPKPRNFNAGLFKVQSTPAGSLPTDADLLQSVTRGLPGSSMPGFAHLAESEI